MIKCCYKNILESSTVALSAGTEDPSYPLYRLYDRNIGRPFKTASASTTEIKISQGGTAPFPADRLLIPAGHNLSGMTLDLKYSDDDAAYFSAALRWIGEAGLIDVSFSPLAKRYWKFIITSPSSKPELAELFLTSTYPWERSPSRAEGPIDDVFNVENGATADGGDRFLIHGEPKRQRTYKVAGCNEAQRENILALNDGWGGAMPLYLFDHEGEWIFGRLRKPINMKETAHRSYEFEFDFLEVL